MSREAIYSALFAAVSGAAGFVTRSRRLRHWSDVAAAEQPALFQIQKSETAKQRRGLPAQWTLAVDLFLYAHAPDELAPPASTLNPLLDAVEAALAPDPVSGIQTLGGLVSHCWIEGKIETDEGVLGGQAVAVIPVLLLAPGL